MCGETCILEEGTGSGQIMSVVDVDLLDGAAVCGAHLAIHRAPLASESRIPILVFFWNLLTPQTPPRDEL